MKLRKLRRTVQTALTDYLLNRGKAIKPIPCVSCADLSGIWREKTEGERDFWQAYATT